MTNWLQDFLNSEFVTNFIIIIIKTVMIIINIILWPFSKAIELLLPDFDQGLLAISDMFVLAGTYVGYILDMLLIPKAPLVLALAFYSMILIGGFTFWGVKLAVSWLRTLKP